MEPTPIADAFITKAGYYLSSEYLPKILRCLEQLQDEQIWWRPNETSNSVGNLVLHLCGNATQWIISGVGGAADFRNRDSEFEQRESIERARLIELLESTVRDVVRVLDDLNREILLETRKIQGNDVQVLEAIFHVTEHFSMHTGQIILLTKTLTSDDLRFYEFEDGAPVHRWREAQS